jgi:hypothetical protein
MLKNIKTRNLRSYKAVITIIVILAASANPSFSQRKTPVTSNVNDGIKERQYLVQVLTRIADPVLNALSKNELKKTMPVERKEDRALTSSHLEAFGRLMAGIASWLELGPDDTPEGKIRKKYIDLSIACIRNAVDTASPDFLNFYKGGGQPLVDAAFFAQALLRAPNQLWGKLDKSTQTNVLNALRSSRVITPGYNNWLLFSAEIEAALLRFEGKADMMRIDYAIRQHMLWYKGDGMYGDGPDFHFDYYNSFVIQPMLIEVMQTLVQANNREDDKKLYNEILKRSQRYAAIQERLISPEATFPPIGRSLAYRFGALQLLSKIAQMHALPKEIQPQQVRAALYAVIKRQVEAPDTFDKAGWLRIGFFGHQPGIGEGYISTGSLYLCSEAFIMLGLPEADPFWQGKDLPWTQRKIWDGEDVPTDHALSGN